MNTINLLPFLTTSLGERMQEAAFNTLIGMGIVFVVLVFISFIIYLFKFLPGSPANKAKDNKKKQGPKQTKVDKPVSTSTSVQDTNSTDTISPDVVAVISAAVMASENELVAVITAAIMASMEEEGIDVPADGLVIRSIRRKTTYKK